MHARTILVALGVSLALGCDARRATLDAARSSLDASDVDASALDAASADARSGPDSGRLDTGLGPDAARDGGIDAGVADGGVRDAGLDGGRDGAVPRDAGGRDAPTSDSGVPGSVIACAPVVGSGATAGLLFSSNLWPGFRFQLTSAARLRRVGLELTPDGASTVTGSIVALSGPMDTPDDPALGSGDVLVRADVSVPAASRPIVVGGDLDLALGAGWYALVFSTSTTGGTLPSGGGTGCVSSPGSSYPFTIRQSDGMFILQGAEPHLFVELAP